MADGDSADVPVRRFAQQSLRDADNDEDPSNQMQRESENFNQLLFHRFQVAAASVAQLYKDRVQSGSTSTWTPFQNAAGCVTALYKDGNDVMRRSGEMGFTLGYQKRTKEVMAWAKRKPRHILREDLLSFLCGKPEVGDLRHSRGSSRPRSNHERRFSQNNESRGNAVTEELLHTFQEAITVATFNAAVSNVRHQATNSPAAVGANSPTRRCPSPQQFADLNNFVSEEFARHGLKRPTPPSPTHDAIMDSPTHKKPRFI